MAMEHRTSRRVSTGIIRDNRVASVWVSVEGFSSRTIAWHYRRRFRDGRVYTGEVQR